MIKAGRMWKRLEKMEQRRSPGDGSFTLEALYRSIWRDDPDRYRSLLAECHAQGMNILLTRFEREDAESARRSNHA